MMTKPLDRLLSPPELQKDDASLLGTTQRIRLPRDWPLEEIIICVDVTRGADAYAAPTGDSILSILKRVRLVTNHKKHRTVVDYSGAGLVELGPEIGLNYDVATLGAIASVGTASQLLRIFYRIPFVPPVLSEPLRSFMLLPVHQHDMEPELQLDFGVSADVGATGTVTKVCASIMLRQRMMTPSVDAMIAAKGGYIESDLIETVYTVPVGVSGEQRFDILQPGQYAGIHARFYVGTAAPVIRGDISLSKTVTAPTVWTLESGGFRFRAGSLRHFAAINQFSKTVNAHTALPLWPALATNTQYHEAAGVYFDFLSDGLTDANELGSLLDCNFSANNGQKMQLIGAVAAPTTNAHVVKIGGHRFMGDLSRWQADTAKAA